MAILRDKPTPQEDQLVGFATVTGKQLVPHCQHGTELRCGGRATTITLRTLHCAMSSYPPGSPAIGVGLGSDP